ncbi:MAG: hypothetical protein CSA26_05570 [Desulfobacterales bacterium]|nr:MAG: hypothetical protein CSA26_05570 [Desulfobacterales bacterium]
MCRTNLLTGWKRLKPCRMKMRLKKTLNQGPRSMVSQKPLLSQNRMAKKLEKKEYSIRTCVSCGGKFPKRSLFRHVWNGNEPVRDPEQIFSGRGVYCCKQERCIGKLMAAGKRWEKLFRIR